jgi:hypothetical protein
LIFPQLINFTGIFISKAGDILIYTGSARQIWEAALGALQVRVSKPNYHTWLAKTNGLSYEDKEFVIGVPSAFIAEYLDKKIGRASCRERV